MRHSTTTLYLPVQIDTDIVPVILWLNSLLGVTTEYSCQGDDRQEYPYVLFTCVNPNSLTTILTLFNADDIENDVVCRIFYNDELRYRAQWHNHSHLIKFIEEKIPAWKINPIDQPA